MRILIAVSTLTPGSGLSRYVISLCHLLAKDYEVCVVTTHGGDDVDFVKHEFDTISANIEFIRLGRYPKAIKYLKALRLLRPAKPLLLINNYNGVFQNILPFAKKNVKVVHVLHNDAPDFYRIAAINALRVDSWIAPTQALADNFNAYTNSSYSERVSVIPHGVEEAKYNPRRNNCLEIVFTGVIYAHKGARVLPPVIKELRRQGINLHFTIVGDGILSDWIKTQFAQEIAEGVVDVTGILPHNDVYDIMAKADIFLYPTHVDAFGLVIAEAMINGAVPVVTHLPGITDNLIDDGISGFLLPQDDAEAFVSTIKYLYENRNVLTRTSICAYEKAMSILSFKAMKKGYVNHITNITK